MRPMQSPVLAPILWKSAIKSSDVMCLCRVDQRRALRPGVDPLTWLADKLVVRIRSIPEGTDLEVGRVRLLLGTLYGYPHKQMSMRLSMIPFMLAQKITLISRCQCVGGVVCITPKGCTSTDALGSS